MASTDTERQTEKEILRTLALLGGKAQRDDDIVFVGNEFRIPASIPSLKEAIRFLVAREKELEEETNFSKIFNYRPWDGAYCMWNALQKQFGAVGHRGTQGFFGDDPPRMISIPSGVEEQTQVPWGRFSLPALPNVLFETQERQHPEMGPLFAVDVYGPKKFESHIAGVFKLIENELETNSMYRGKAFDGQVMPEFIDLSGVDPAKVVYSAEVMRQLEANVFSQLRHTEVYERRGIRLKRAVLMHGPFGTGKTLAAILTGQVATANGWTFIKGRPGRDDLGFVMQTARLYQPSVVFYEDVDQVADVENLTGSGISRLLDDFDGIEAKNTRIMCVLTTNYAERITAGMGRPGRLDAFIKITDLDLAGVEKLVKVCVGERSLSDDIDWEQVFEAANGYMPAFVTEFAGRAWRYAFVRTGNENEVLITDDLVEAAHDMRPQFELQAQAKTRHEKPQLELALQETVVNAVRESVIEDVLVTQNGR